MPAAGRGRPGLPGGERRASPAALTGRGGGGPGIGQPAAAGRAGEGQPHRRGGGSLTRGPVARWPRP